MAGATFGSNEDHQLHLILNKHEIGTDDIQEYVFVLFIFVMSLLDEAGVIVALSSFESLSITTVISHW